MAKVEIKNVKSVLKAIETAFEDAITKSDLKERIGAFSVKRVQLSTRSGENLAEEGAPIQDTKDSTKSIKELIATGKIKMKPSRPRYFRSDLSQITQSGQLLKSLKADINDSKNEIIIEPTGKREKIVYTWAETKEPVTFLNENQDIDSNKGLAKDLADRGFEFLGMDVKGRKRIRKLVLDEIRRLIKRFS